MGKSSNSRQKLAFRAARRRVLAPHLRASLVKNLKGIYENAGLTAPVLKDDAGKGANRAGEWGGIEVVPNFMKSGEGRRLNSVHGVKKDVEMESGGNEGGRIGLVPLEQRVKEAKKMAAAIKREKKMEYERMDLVMKSAEVTRGKRGGGVVKNRRKKKRHPKNRPSLKF